MTEYVFCVDRLCLKPQATECVGGVTASSMLNCGHGQYRNLKFAAHKIYDMLHSNKCAGVLVSVYQADAEGRNIGWKWFDRRENHNYCSIMCRLTSLINNRNLEQREVC